MFQRVWICAIALAAIVASSGCARRLTLENDALRVDLNEVTGLVQVTDKVADAVYTQAPAADVFAVDSVKRSGDKLVVNLKGKLDFTATYSLTADSGLALEISADPEAAMENLNWPGPFETPAGDWSLVVADAEGLLIPAAEAPEALRGRGPLSLTGMGGLIMPWAGVVDPDLKQGYMMIVDTEVDAAINYTDRPGLHAAEPVWQPQFDKFGYDRRVLFYFLSDGGYVAQSKKYREFVKENREFSTLRERAVKRPHIDRLIGAMHIYTWAEARTVEFAKEMKAAGIEKAWVGWDTSHPPYPDPSLDQGLKDLGYLSGVYDLYRDMYDHTKYEELGEIKPVFKEMWLHRYYYPGLFPAITAVAKDQNYMIIGPGGDTGLTRYWVCTKSVVPHVHDKVNREIAVYPHDSVFVDVTLAANPFECWSPEHPMTRTEDRAARMEIHKILANDFNMVVGSEYGADYGVAHTEFMHGLMTQHKYRWGVREKDDPRYQGDFSNLAQPSMVLGENVPTEEYQKYGLGENYRIPLFELVYHDCTVSTWRWDDPSHKQPATWHKKDLFNILYGTPPCWNLDGAKWAQYKDRFAESYKTMGPWLEKIGYDEMTNHRFLTADRTVQECEYSSGYKAIVNFGSKAYVGEGVEVAPESHVIVAPGA